MHKLNFQPYINNNDINNTFGEIAYIEDNDNNIMFYYLIINPKFDHKYGVMIAGKMHKCEFETLEEAKDYCNDHFNNIHRKYNPSATCKRKYELLTNDTETINGITLYRIRALRDFGDVKAGDLGGYIQSEHNLSHEDHFWIPYPLSFYGDQCVTERMKFLFNAEYRRFENN